MANFLEQEEIYKIVFGKEYDASNQSVYYDKLHVNVNNSGGSIPIPMYAKIADGKIVDLVTGTEIPIIYRSDIPGFGVYSMSPLISIEDYETFLVYFKIATKNLSSYKEELESMMQYLDDKRLKYCKAYSVGGRSLDEISIQEYQKQQEMFKVLALETIESFKKGIK